VTELDDYAPFDLLGGALHIQIFERLLLELQLLDLPFAFPSCPGGHVALPSAPERRSSPSTDFTDENADDSFALTDLAHQRVLGQYTQVALQPTVQMSQLNPVPPPFPPLTDARLGWRSLMVSLLSLSFFLVPFSFFFATMFLSFLSYVRNELAARNLVNSKFNSDPAPRELGSDISAGTPGSGLSRRP
jgi:hypothetical protein